MEKKKLLIWMNCYGSWAPELRHPIETIGYNQYLDAFVESISLFKERISDIYISGGMFDANDMSECETTKPELERRFKNKRMETNIKTDEDSFTSASIMKKFLTTWKNNYQETIPLIFIDEARFETNKYSFEQFCKELGIDLDPLSTIIPLPRPDNHPHSTKEFQQQKVELMKEKGIDFVEEAELEKRKEHIEKRRRKLQAGA